MRITHVVLLGILASSSLASDSPAAPEIKPAVPKGGTVTGTVVTSKKGKVVVDAPDVWVYLAPTKLSAKVPQPPRTAIAQKGRQFVPRVRVVPVGTVIDFPNNDNEEHSVYSPGEPGFDLKRYTGGKSDHESFDVVGEHDIYCDIHKDMSAKVKVVDSQYIAKVEHGRFTLTGVPAGSYKVVAWAPDSEESRVRIVVTEGGTVTLNPDELKVVLGPAKPHRFRYNNTPYPPYPK